MHFRWNSTIIFTSSSSAPLAAHSSAVPISHVSEGGFSCLHLHFPTLFCCKTEMILCQDSRCWAKRKIPVKLLHSHNNCTFMPSFATFAPSFIVGSLILELLFLYPKQEDSSVKSTFVVSRIFEKWNYFP